jgi:Uma2 family endonuclease
MVATIEQKVTWDEYRDMEFDDHDLFIYELLNGILVRRTAPSVTHQRISRKILRFLDTFINEKKLGEVFTAPIDVYFDGKNGVQPDLVFIKTDRLFIIENEDYINGAPDLVVEVISPGSIRRDRVEKKDLYEQYAVKEFWLIDPQNKTVEIYTMENNAYRLHEFQEQTGKITSLVLEGFEIDAKDIFDSLS